MSRNRVAKSRVTSLLTCALLFVIGCEQPGLVSGLVTLDGDPLTTGVITFNPTAGGPTAYGAIGTDGRYELHTGAAQGLAAGEYIVTVAANAAAPAEPSQPPSTAESTAESAPEAEEAPPAGPPVLPLLTPEKYADLDRTPLRATIKGGEQVLEFHLASE